jgi:hypothetical protein
LAKILNAASANGNISKMVELPDNFIINSQLYDKGTLSPIAYSFCPIVVSASNEVLLNKVAYPGTYWCAKHVSNGCIIDSNDPNICYVASTGATMSTSNAYIYKLTTTATGIQVASTIIGTGNTYAEHPMIISQDQNYVYFFWNRNYGGSTGYIARINKITMGIDQVNLNCGTMKVLKETDLYIYFFATVYATTTCGIARYNKNTNASTWIFQDTQANYYFDAVPTDMDENGVFYLYKDGKDFGMADHYACFRKYTFDYLKETVTTSIVTVENDTNVHPSGKLLFTSGSGMPHSPYMFKFIDPITKKKYISLMIYNNGSRSITLQTADSMLVTYEIIDSSNFKIVSYIPFNPVIYKAFLPVLGNQVLMLAAESTAHIYNWSSEKKSFVKVASYDGNITSIGCDTNNNMYIQYGDTSVEMISSVMPTTVYSDFKDEVYDYAGSDVETSVVCYVKNFAGQYISSTMELTLYGNVKFTDTGLKTKQVTSSNVGSIEVPVTIYDTGLLRVANKII